VRSLCLKSCLKKLVLSFEFSFENEKIEKMDKTNLIDTWHHYTLLFSVSGEKTEVAIAILPLLYGKGWNMQTQRICGVSAPCMFKLYLRDWLTRRCLRYIGYASVTSSYAHRYSIFFLGWQIPRGWGHLTCQMPRCWVDWRGQIPCPWDCRSPSNTAAVFIHFTIVPLSAFKCVIFRFCRSASPSSNWLIMQTTLHDSWFSFYCFILL